jgi:hypothetical protein
MTKVFWIRAGVTAGRCGFHALSRPAKRHASSIMAVAPATEQPSPRFLRRLEHEYSLAAELDPAWAAKPLALARQEARITLILADPGGKPLDRVLERYQEQPSI